MTFEEFKKSLEADDRFESLSGEDKFFWLILMFMMANEETKALINDDE